MAPVGLKSTTSNSKCMEVVEVRAWPKLHGCIGHLFSVTITITIIYYTADGVFNSNCMHAYSFLTVVCIKFLCSAGGDSVNILQL